MVLWFVLQVFVKFSTKLLQDMLNEFQNNHSYLFKSKRKAQ